MPRTFGNAQDIEGQAQDCDMNERAAQFAAIWMQRLGDKASEMTCDSRLVLAAQTQADWLAMNDFDETNPHLGENGSSANARARAAGYRLPSWFGNANNVESVARDWNPDMAAVVDGLMAHDTHHAHMHVILDFSEHVVYGIGSEATYYVVVTAPTEGD